MALRCTGVGLVSTVSGWSGVSRIAVMMVLLANVARSASNVRKLCTGKPSGVRWSPETGQAAKRESLLGAADRPKVRHDQYSEETRS